MPRPERIPEEEKRNEEELLIDPNSEEEAELDSDDEDFNFGPFLNRTRNLHILAKII